MKLLIITPFVLLFSQQAFAYVDVCDYIDLPACSGIKKQGRRSSNQSSASPTTAASSNPANISLDKGIGVETLYQPHNPVGFSFLSGTGKIGGALISPYLENSFFGNRVPEIDDILLERERAKYRYRTKKINMAFGSRVLNKKTYGIDLGIPVRYNPDMRQINTGLGASVHIGNFNFGLSRYRDDVYFDLKDYINPYTSRYYRDIYGKSAFSETYTVTTYSFGISLGPLNLDYGRINSQYQFYQRPTHIEIYSSALSLKNWRFNYAFRKEHSDRYEYIDDGLVRRRVKRDQYYGLQYSLNKKMIIGTGYNFFLVRDITATFSLFL